MVYLGDIMYHHTQLRRSVIITLLSTFIAMPTIGLTAQETENPTNIPMEDVQRFSNAISLIKQYYVKPIDDKELFDNAIRGMLSGLDPHSTYLNENEFKELQTSTSGEFGGLGLEVTMEDGVIKVVTPLIDTPAFKSGIKAGDYIIKLDSQSAQGLTLQDAVNKMRGKQGSLIKLTVLRKGVNKPLMFTVMRENILIKSVKSQLLDNGYGYIRISQFQATTVNDMENAIVKLQQDTKNQLKGLILDLRNNPGGLLDSAIQISDDFLNANKNGKKDTIVYTQGRLPGSHFIATANPGDVLNNAPMVVLINNGSASAAEIVAGALHDNKRAIIVGTQSFGKGSVQTILPLDDKRGIKLTTALYYTPSGTSIQAKGITPDVVVEAIDIPQSASNKDQLMNFSESELNGHLTPTKTNDVTINSSKDDKKLLHEDYQLYAALTILKSLAIAKR